MVDISLMVLTTGEESILRKSANLSVVIIGNCLGFSLTIIDLGTQIQIFYVPLSYGSLLWIFRISIH